MKYKKALRHIPSHDATVHFLFFVTIRPGLLLIEAGLAVDGTLVAIRPGLLFSGCIAAMGSAPLCQLSQATADKVPRKGAALDLRGGPDPLDSHARKLANYALRYAFFFFIFQRAALLNSTLHTPHSTQSTLHTRNSSTSLTVRPPRYCPPRRFPRPLRA